jgi:hypothetical protein
MWKGYKGYHQGIIEAFAKSYEGNKATIGPLEIQVDEASIASATGMPRTGQKWFKITVTKNLDFRPYLKLEFKNIIWKRDIPISHLEEKWKSLLKAIQLYITTEGRYDMAMLYHFKLMDHFTGNVSLNLPYYFHRSLTKMSHKVQIEPDHIQNTLFHFGLIKMIIVEELKKRERTWEQFLFWGGFELETQPDKGKRKSRKKSPTPQSSLKRRRAINPNPSEEPASTSRVKKAKKNLVFKEAAEQASTW